MARLAAEQEIKVAQLYENLGIQRESNALRDKLERSRIQTQRDIAALRAKNEELKARLQAENLSKGFDTF